MDTNFKNNARKLRFLFFPIFFLLGGLIVKLLWNAILPAVIPAIHAVTYWQAVGILTLSKLLFGFGGRPHGGDRQHFRNKMLNMSDEERAQFKAEWKEKCRR
jgi:hypothetical protein